MYDVIVVGTRAAGASTAMLLARAGLRVLALDQAKFPSDTVSSHQIAPPGIGCLARWGLLGTIAAVTPAVESLSVSVAGVRLSGRVPVGDGGWPMYSPRRTILDSVLVDAARAAGAEMRERFRVTGLEWSDGRVVGVRGRAGISGTVVDRARLVIGADGKHSVVADAVGASYRHFAEPATVAAYGYFAGMHQAGGELHLQFGRAAAAFPTNDGLTVAYTAVPVAQFSAFRADIQGSYFGSLDRCDGLGSRVRAGRRVGRIRLTPDLPQAVRVSAGPGWALVGDSGLVLDPITAQGISNAFLDAEVLCRAVVSGLDNPLRLATELSDYQRLRHARTAAMYQYTAELATLRPNPHLAATFELLRDRPAEANTFIGLLTGAVPTTQFSTVRDLLPLLRPGGMLRAARRAVTTYRSGRRAPLPIAEAAT